MHEPSSKNRAGGTPTAGAGQVPETAPIEADAASGSRRRSTDDDAFPSRYAALHAAQVRAVGTAFLRARPLVVAPIAALNLLLMSASGAPLDQRIALGAGIALALLLFMLERWWLGRAVIGVRWLAVSLASTSVMLAGACAVSGGLSSPIFPLSLAPVVVAAAAFGRSVLTIATSGLSLALAGVLALLPTGTPFPPIPAPYDRAMTVVAVGGLLLLAYAGVAGLVGAYVRAGEVLDRMRLATIEEAASRMRATEQVGAKVAHEIKNPLAAIKALLQLLRDRIDDTGRKRLEVALGEVDRMDAIVRDYLAFARPLADLELGSVDLALVAGDVVSVLEDRARLANVALAARGGSGPVRADARRLREAIFNLVDNALAATPPGGRVTIEVTAVPGGAEVAIEDTGTGIAPELATAPAFTTTRAEGTGLGLTIARAAIAQHGGTLHFRSRPGGGTMARMTIPADPGAVA